MVVRVECWPAAERWEGGPAAIPHAVVVPGAGWELEVRSNGEYGQSGGICRLVGGRAENSELGLWESGTE